MKHTLIEAKAEIEALRRQNEILRAKVEVMDLFACALHSPPATYNPAMGANVTWELEREIARIESEEIARSTIKAD